MSSPPSQRSKWGYTLDDMDPPADPSVAAAYWCDLDYFLAHTGSGEHPPCRCAPGVGHNDPDFPRRTNV